MPGTTIARGGFMFVDECLGEAIGAAKEVLLNTITNNVQRIAREKCGASPITRAQISRLLRKRGFTKVGMSGGGYDTQPVYRAAA